MPDTRDSYFFDSYIDNLIEKAEKSSDLGLWYGKTGVAVTLFCMEQLIQNKKYKETAIKLIDTVCDNISSSELNPDFANGLSGIGCGFEYIISNKFVEGNSDKILSDIDFVLLSIINRRTLDKIRLEDGICGIGYYLYNRLKNKNSNENTLQTLQIKEYLIYLTDWLEEELNKTCGYYEICDIYFLLCRLRKLNIFNYKINKMAGLCLGKLGADSNKNIYDSYFCMGIPSLKLLTNSF